MTFEAADDDVLTQIILSAVSLSSDSDFLNTKRGVLNLSSTRQTQDPLACRVCRQSEYYAFVANRSRITRRCVRRRLCRGERYNTGGPRHHTTVLMFIFSFLIVEVLQEAWNWHSFAPSFSPLDFARLIHLNVVHYLTDEVGYVFRLTNTQHERGEWLLPMRNTSAIRVGMPIWPGMRSASRTAATDHAETRPVMWLFSAVRVGMPI